MAESIDIRSELLDLQHREPFVAFTIVMASGERCEVGTQSGIVVGMDTAMLFPPRRGGYVTLQMFQISSIEVLDPE